MRYRLRARVSSLLLNFWGFSARPRPRPLLLLLPSFLRRRSAAAKSAQEKGAAERRLVVGAVRGVRARPVDEEADPEARLDVRSGNLWRARSRLHRSQILQVKTRWKALTEIYTMHSFATFWNPPFLESIIENWGKKNLAKTNPKKVKTRGH